MDRYGTTPRAFSMWPEYAMSAIDRLALLLEKGATIPGIKAKFIADCLRFRADVCAGALERYRHAYQQHATHGSMEWNPIDLNECNALLECREARVSDMQSVSDSACEAVRIRCGSAGREVQRQINLMVLLLEEKAVGL